MNARKASNRAASILWSSGSWLVRLAAERGMWAKPARLPTRVISVGNLQAGGGGKTPLVAQIAREAAGRGKTVCILTRGYGGEWERGGGVLRPLQQGGAPGNALLCGDEAALLQGLAPAAWIGVGADRAAQFLRICNESGGSPELTILDDGFQHWKIVKNLEVVAVTSRRPGEVVFRDWPRALSRADLVVWTKGEREPVELLAGRPRVRTRSALENAPVAGQRVWLVTGVADPGSVVETVQAAGYRVERHFRFPDHAAYSEPLISQLLTGAAASGLRVALTGKDYVKWKGFGVRTDEVIVLEPRLEFVEGRELWERALWES